MHGWTPDDESSLFKHDKSRISQNWQTSAPQYQVWKAVFISHYPECARIAHDLDCQSYKIDLHGLLDCLEQLSPPLNAFEQRLAQQLETKLGSLHDNHFAKQEMDLDSEVEVKLYSTEGLATLEQYPAYPRDSVKPPSYAEARATNEVVGAGTARYSNELVQAAHVRRSNEAQEYGIRIQSIDSIAIKFEESVVIKEEPMDDFHDVPVHMTTERTRSSVFIKVLSCLYRALRALLLRDMANCRMYVEKLVQSSKEFRELAYDGHDEQRHVEAPLMFQKHTFQLINKLLTKSKLDNHALTRKLMECTIFWKDDFWTDESFNSETELLFLELAWADAETSLLAFTDEVD
jgi:hypothetical protein